MTGVSVKYPDGGTAFPTTGHFIALINQSQIHRTEVWQAWGERKTGGALFFFLLLLPPPPLLHSILTACSLRPLPGFSADLLGVKCHLAQTGVASTDTIDWPRSEPGERGSGGAGERSLPLLGFKVYVK